MISYANRFVWLKFRMIRGNRSHLAKLHVSLQHGRFFSDPYLYGEATGYRILGESRREWGGGDFDCMPGGNFVRGGRSGKKYLRH